MPYQQAWKKAQVEFTMADQQSRTVLITGAAKRIGRAIALSFATAGWQVAVHYRSSSESADELVAEITRGGGRSAAFQADLTAADEVRRLIPECVERLGPLHCLINNASQFDHDEMGSITDDLWSGHLDTNLRAPVLLTQSFVEHLPEDADANVINIIDQRVLRPTPEFFSYTISKCALWTATRMMAQALAPRVRVNAVSPGPVLPSVHQTEQDFEQERRSTLLRRGTSGEEIAAAIRFILDAPAMTGQMITLDGGQHLTWSEEASPASLIDKPSKRRNV